MGTLKPSPLKTIEEESKIFEKRRKTMPAVETKKIKTSRSGKFVHDFNNKSLESLGIYS